MPTVTHFSNILVWALPASGKSEILTVLRRMDPVERLNRLHIGYPAEIDDYKLVAEWFKSDDDREEASGLSRVYTKRQTPEDGGFKSPKQWEYLTGFLNLQYNALLAATPDIHSDSTVLLECARGGPEGATGHLPNGYERVLNILDESLLGKAAILYVRVAPEESRRKNRERFDPNDPLGTMGHMVPARVMRDDYGCDDIDRLMNLSTEPGFVECSGLQIPIGVFDNQDDKTSFVRKNISDGERKERTCALTNALEEVLDPLFKRYQSITGNVDIGS